MNWIFILILLVVTSLQTHPFAQTDILLSLTSMDHYLEVSPKHDCSCQLDVFSVYQDRYNLGVKSKEGGHTHVRIRLGTSGQCLNSVVDSTCSAVIGINEIWFNGYEITQTFLIEFYSPQPTTELNCEGIQEKGEERVVYLVNRTKEQAEGEYHYIINIPKNSIAVTQAFSFVLLVLLTHNIKYRRFTPWTFNIPFALVYAVFLFVTVYIEAYIEDSLMITFWLVMLFALCCSAIYFIDIMSICLSRMAAIVGVSLFLSLTLGLVDILIFPDAWPVNNLLGILVAGALIKFIVIKKLRSAIIPLAILWVFFVFRQFIVFLHLENFEQALQNKVVPLFLQLPGLFGDDSSGFICSAFGTSKIITMGLVLNYCVRIDLFLSNRFYTLLSSIVAFLCLAVQYMILALAGDMPVMEYTSIIAFLPISIMLMLLFSAKRGEWAQLWHGSFHDIAVDRKSIRRQSDFGEQDLDSHLQSLRMNPTLLINDDR